jgi:putative copper export protein
MILEFSEPAIPSGSRITVTGPHHKELKISKLLPEDGGREIAVKLPGGIKPGVYTVDWLALGIDGHNVSGTFEFGVAEKNGSLPPGSSSLGGPETGALGGTAAGQSPFSVVATWLGVAAAALALGGLLLVTVLRRKTILKDPDPLGGLGRLLGIGWFLAVLAALESVIANASAGANSGFSISLLTASATGISAIVRLGIALAAGIALFTVQRWPNRQPRPEVAAIVYAVGGFGLLATYGVSGHVVADGSTLAEFGMVIHVVCAGIWAGGVITLFILAFRRHVSIGPAARAFAPIAIVALGIAGITGLIAAFREVDHWYFLRWSTYGNVVIVKIGVVALAAAAGAVTTWRTRQRSAAGDQHSAGQQSSATQGSARHGRGLLAFEAGLVVLVIGIASVLSGLAQGRGQPLPAQKGDLLPGPAFATALLPQGSANVTLTPAQVGLDSLIVAAPASAHKVEVRMACGCDIRPVISILHPDANGSSTFEAAVPIPTAGDWYAYLYINGHQAASPVSLAAGVPTAPGAPVQTVVSIADMSGPGAVRCREYVEGLDLAIGRLNSNGGVDGGDKVALDVLDDGGSRARAAALVPSALNADPIAFMPCGAGSEPALADASRDGLPSIVGDPAVGLVNGPFIYRIAADPYADGYAIAEALRETYIPSSPKTANTVLVVPATDPQGARRVAGLEAELSGATIGGVPVRIKFLSYAALIRTTGASLYSMIERTKTLAFVIDGTDAEEPGIAAALKRLPATLASYSPATIIASDRLLSEQLIESSGETGQLGVIEGTAEVAVDSDDALAVADALPSMFPGVNASLESLRGFVAGQALTYAVAGATSVTDLTARLYQPAPFTDAIVDPWLSDAPAAGSPRVGLMVPNFLDTTLLPTTAGGEQYTGQYFSDGAWERTTSLYYGPPLTAPVPKIGLVAESAPRTTSG